MDDRLFGFGNYISLSLSIYFVIYNIQSSTCRSCFNVFCAFADDDDGRRTLLQIIAHCVRRTVLDPPSPSARRRQQNNNMSYYNRLLIIMSIITIKTATGFFGPSFLPYSRRPGKTTSVACMHECRPTSSKHVQLSMYIQ